MKNRALRSARLTNLLVLMAGVFATTSALAQEAEGDEELGRNVVEIFAGSTFSEGNSKASMGASYHRRIWTHTSIGILAENTSAEEWVFVAPITWRIGGPWEVWIAPGIERAYGEEEDENEFLTRIGAAVEFEFSGWTLAPEINLDFVDHETKTVLGVSVGWEF